jgi:hypothetical protein
MVPEGPFIAPKDLGAIEALFGSSHPSLSMGVQDCPVVHRAMHSTTVGGSLIGHFPFQTGTRLPEGGGAPDFLMLHLTVGAG